MKEDFGEYMKPFFIPCLFKFFALMMCLSFPHLAYGKSIVVVKTVRQHITGEISPDQARKFAVSRAKQDALEEAGTYLEALTVVKEGNLAQDEILALSVGVLKTEVVKEKQFMDGNVFCMEATVKIEVDPSVLQPKVQKLLDDQEHLQLYKEAERKNRQLINKIAQLEKENRRIKKTTEESQRLKRELTIVSKAIDADMWFDKAMHLNVSANDSDRFKKLAFLSQAIDAAPKHLMALFNRGLLYSDMKEFDSAINDFSKVVNIYPKFSLGFVARGDAYGDSGQYNRAIGDYKKAIQIGPVVPTGVYVNLGNAYSRIGKKDQAIAAFNNAIQLNPNLVEAYYNRGIVYGESGQIKLAINDYSKAIKIDSEFERAFFNRGVVYASLGLKQKAINDFSKVIKINPEKLDAYYNRGLIYLQEGKRDIGCADALKACELGACDLLDAAGVLCQ